MTDSCQRCVSLEQQIEDLQGRLQFRPCGHTAPGSALAEVTMPDGRVTRGILCLPHTVLLGAALGAQVLGEQAGPCGWLVPAEESMAGRQVPEQDPVEVAG